MTKDEMELKLAQAYQVIGVYDSDDLTPDEEMRALDYFASDEYNEDFLPWPREG